MNLSVNIAGVEFKNPVTVASGTFGSGAEYHEFVDRISLVQLPQRELQTCHGRVIQPHVLLRRMAV